VNGGGPSPSNRSGSNLSGFGKNCGEKCERPTCQNTYATPKKTKKGGMHVFSTKDITTTLVMLRKCQLPKNDFQDIEKICIVCEYLQMPWFLSQQKFVRIEWF
jgi:hypothetical protein